MDCIYFGGCELWVYFVEESMFVKDKLIGFLFVF